MRKKIIQVGEYWTVKYSNYEGAVLVKEELGPGDYSCVLSRKYPEPKWVNRLSGSRFKHRDFREKIEEVDFLIDRLKWMSQESALLTQKIKDLCEI